MDMTKNEKRIITMLSRLGPLSKTQLCRRGHMALATAVKMADRLEKQNVIRRVDSAQRSRSRGKPPYLYDLNGSRPLAIGIDMEYEVTTITLTNLKGEDLGHSRHQTPSDLTLDRLKEFLLDSTIDFMNSYVSGRTNVAGLGIGIPGMDLPTRLIHSTTYEDTALREFLETQLGMRVHTDVNTRVYTLYRKWMGRPLANEDFMLLSVRSGLGLGIILNGRLFVSRQGFAGGIGHYKVYSNGGERCRCGDRGCLETVTNEHYFHRAYWERVLQRTPSSSHDRTGAARLDSVAQLFTEASRGHPEATRILRESAKYLSYALGPAIMVLNVPHIILGGHFGPDGSVFARMLSEEVRKRILADIDFDLQYEPLEDRGFTQGAALLVLGEYFTQLPEAQV